MACVAIYLSLFIFAPFVVLGAQEKSDRARDAGQPEAASGEYVLQPQDLIRVQIFQEPDLNRDLRLSQEFSVTLPLIGTIDLKDKKVRQAEELIRKLYDADYLVKPQVNITVVEYAPRTMEVFGAVGIPGVIVFPREEQLTLTGAISRAGSFNRLANKKAVTLKRILPDGKIETFAVNVEELMKGETSNTWPLQPGDVVTVPERIL